jgi:hypothetical protein
LNPLQGADAAGQPSMLVAARTPRTTASAMTSAANDPSIVNGMLGLVSAPVDTANS